MGPGQPQGTIPLHASEGLLHNGRCKHAENDPGGSFLQLLRTDCTQPRLGAGGTHAPLQEVSLGLSSSCVLGALAVLNCHTVHIHTHPGCLKNRLKL